ncbi:MAG TPA: class I SAM-dependent methyltransferase [Candidatus Limnocylindria bacterium]|nr:class I SAM-dependent methyltransferase [Candidatus Limnocylindria bacterium]
MTAGGNTTVTLDPRLLCAATLVPACEVAADIGCDHGRLAVYLLQTGRCSRVIASDISPASRERAGALFMRLGISDRVTLSGRDGLDALTENVGAVVISGMGGKTIARILARDVDLHGAALILSPQTDLPLARDAVYRRGYHIRAEYAVQSRGRHYLVWEALPGVGEMSEAERMVGVALSDCAPGSAREYMLWQLRVALSWQGDEGSVYRKYLEEALSHANDDGSGGP